MDYHEYLATVFSRKIPTYRIFLCTPFIFSFVAFNLLDLHGSNLTSLNRYAEPYILFGEQESEFRIKPLTERVQYLDNSFNLMP